MRLKIRATHIFNKGGREGGDVVSRTLSTRRESRPAHAPRSQTIPLTWHASSRGSATPLLLSEKSGNRNFAVFDSFPVFHTPVEGLLCEVASLPTVPSGSGRKVGLSLRAGFPPCFSPLSSSFVRTRSCLLVCCTAFLRATLVLLALSTFLPFPLFPHTRSQP